jgi:hypothetical protein
MYPNTALYAHDFYTWTQTTAETIRTGKRLDMDPETLEDNDRCVNCGMVLKQHTHSASYAVFWCHGCVGQQIYLAPWQAAAGYCGRCGQTRAHHRAAPDGRVWCRLFAGQVYLAAIPGQSAADLQAWDEAAEAMRQAMTTVFLILQLHFAT